MKNLSIDLETYSSIDIAKAGAFKYAESSDFEILLFAYKIDDRPVQLVDMAAGEKIPPEIVSALSDSDVIKHAYNATFEWLCINRIGIATPIEQWQCTMIHGMYCGYPAGLEAIGKAMRLPEDEQKLRTGKALIKYFCQPCKPTKANGGRSRNLPEHAPEKWALFKSYNLRDVETEYAIQQRLKVFPVPEEVWIEWHHDVELNARGVAVDINLVGGALELNERRTAELMSRAREVTGMSNPKSNKQLLEWLASQGVSTPNLQKATVSDMLAGDLPDPVREMLEIKQQLGKSSVSKYEAMERTICGDNRVRGLLQFYGASRSGRWSGRLVQMQNLPQNHLPTLDEARQMVKRKDYAGIRMIYGNVPDTLSQLIRTAFIPAEGEKFIVSDFSAIEARVIAWLADESWVLDTFRSGGDIYCATASQMFGVPVEKHGINGHLRQKGKIATLALGYQGGTGALISMGALKMGISEEDLPDIVTKWRAANPNIVQLWSRVEKLATYTIDTAKETYLHGLTFRLEGDIPTDQKAFTIELPSGRKLFYRDPRLADSRFGKPAIHYMGVNQTTKKWEEMETYGGKLVENCVQAIARDCLAITIERLIEEGYTPVMHIHDEVIIEADPDQHLDDVNAIFAEQIPWAPGLPLKAAGFEANYYMKD